MKKILITGCVGLLRQPIQDVKKMDYEVTKNIYNFRR